MGEKLTALDANCDGTADGGDASFGREAPVAPGQCAVYRILFGNSGGAAVTNVVIRDATPPWTTFLGGSEIYLSTPAGLTSGIPILPASGASGDIAFPFSGALPPGPQGAVQFTVRLE